jgi:hypothetical protein
MTNTLMDLRPHKPQAPSADPDTTNEPKDHTVLHPLDISSIGIDPVVAPLAPDSPRPPGQDEPEEADRRVPVARCADGHGTLTALFFSDNIHDISRAKAMCGLCPLREQCLADALEREEPWGVWGGELLSGGRIIANKRPAGRPPTHPRPEVVYDEMGPVGVPA